MNIIDLDASKILRHAQELLMQDGWIQGNWKASECTTGCCGASIARCAMGAVAELTGDLIRRASYGGVEWTLRNRPSHQYRECERILGVCEDLESLHFEYYGEYDPTNYEADPVTYNDRTVKNLDDVLDWFDEAIDLAKEHEALERNYLRTI